MLISFSSPPYGLSLSAVILFAAAGTLCAQPDNVTLTINAAVLDTSTEVVKRLATIEDHVKSRQWENAIQILEQVKADHGDSLVGFDGRRYLNVSTYCNSILANLPPAGLAVYREKYDAQAKQWLEAGVASRDPALLEKIVLEAFVSRSCDQALFVLGEWAWDRGEFATAREHWRTLLKLRNPPDAGKPQPALRYPDSLHPPAEIISRIVLCHLMEGDQPLAKIWLAHLAKEYPEARGKLAGREGVFAELLGDVLRESRDWPSPPIPVDTPTFAGNPQRNPTNPEAPEIGGVQWEVPLPLHHHEPRSTINGTQACYYPIVAGGTVFFSDPNQIYALDLQTGKAKWPISDDGTIKERSDLDRAAIFKGLEEVPLPRQYRIGMPRFTLTVHENRLYARMGSPVTWRISQASETLKSQLVCLDLTKQGKVQWTKNPAEVLPKPEQEIGRQLAFEGTPVAAGGRVFAAVRQSLPQTESYVVCLDAETGRPEWSRRVASAVSMIAEQQDYMSHHLLTLGESMVFFLPEYGVLSALEADTGRLAWAVRYPSNPRNEESKFLDGPKWQGFTPCVFHRGVVYAAPADSDRVLAVSARTGEILWQQQIEFRTDHFQHILGVVGDELVLSGNRLWILDAITGKVKVPERLDSGRHPVADGFGRGLIAGKSIFWPTRNTLETRNFAGERTTQPRPMTGGNLLATKDLLIVAEPKRLVAYGKFARVKETPQGQLSRNPVDADSHSQLAQQTTIPLKESRLEKWPEPKLPLVRNYEHKLPAEAHVVIPAGRPPLAKLECVLVQDRKLTCLDRQQGTSRWVKQLGHDLQWAAYAKSRLLLGTESALLAVELESGETIWRDTLLEAPSSGLRQFALIGNRVLLLGDQAVICIHAETGRGVWRKDFPVRLAEIWFLDAEFLVVQSPEPKQLFVIQTQTGKELSRHSLNAAWTSPPVRIENARVPGAGFAVALDNRQIRAFSAIDAKAELAWNYQGAFSSANSPPVLWSDGGHLILLLDGDTLVKVDPKTGETIWAKMLAHSPLDHPSETVVLDGNSIFAITHNFVACLDLEDGRKVWQQPLPPHSGWTLQKRGGLLIALAKGAGAAQNTLLFFDAKTGRRGQDVRAGSNITAGSFREESSVLVSRGRLLGYRGMDFSLASELTPPADDRDD